MDEKKNIVVEAYVDKRGAAKWTEKKVYMYEELKILELERCIFFVSQKFYKDEVTDDLMKMGVPFENIVTFFDDTVFDQFYYDLNKNVKSKRIVNESLKNLFLGERCFVIGHGPSLREEDLLKIKDEKTFTVNSMCEHFKRLKWNPTFYFCSDRVNASRFVKNKGEFEELLNSVEMVFFEEKTEVFQKYCLRENDNLYFYRSQMPVYKELSEAEEFFSSDITKGVYTVGTVLYDELQFATYMGFREIYLLGVDFKYKHEIHNNGERVNNNEIISNYAKFIGLPETYDDNAYEFIDRMLAGYIAAKKYADKHNIKIYNATRGGNLEVFQRVDFDKLF